jgi:AcrR family transcriptional regulator
MARTPKEDYVPLMISAAADKLRQGDEVKVSEIAKTLGVSTALVHFYFKERQDLVAAAWREIFLAFVTEDQARIDQFAPGNNWDGVAGLVREIFSEDRDEIHLAHFRGLYEATRNPKFAEISAEVQAETIRSWVELMHKYEQLGIVKLRVPAEIIALLITSVPPGISAIRPDLSEQEREHLALLWVNMLRSVLDANDSNWVDF